MHPLDYVFDMFNQDKNIVICNGKKKCRNHIECSELFFKQEVETDSHNDCISDHTYLTEQFALQNIGKSACKKADAALINQHRHTGEDNAESEGCAKNYGVNKVERRFDKKN